MLNYNEVSVYKTPDGKIFEDPTEAEKHGYRISLRQRAERYADHSGFKGPAWNRLANTITRFLMWENQQPK